MVGSKPSSAPVGRHLATEPAAWLLLALLAGVWSWWAVAEGAYRSSALYEGLIVLAGGLLVLLAVAPLRVRLSHGARVAMIALGGLGVLYALSALWSPAPDVAIADGQRVLGCALAFGLGIWLCRLLNRRMTLALAPLAIAGAIAGIVAVTAMIAGNELERYLDEGTLQYPLGYRNANGAFFLIAFWPALGLATERGLDWRLRGAALGVATLCLDLALLSQSRASAIAAAIAIAAFVALSPSRARSLGWLVLAVVPALMILPALTDLFAAGQKAALPFDELRAAGRASAASAALSILAGAGLARLEPRLSAFPARMRINWDRIVAIGFAGTLAAAAVAFTIAVGNPIGWIDQRIEELGQGTPSFTDEPTRFGLSAGSNREDLWRVALEAAAEEPLLGDGGGGYRYRYTRERTVAHQYARDAHGVGFEVVAELGLPGLALLVVVIAAMAAGALRSRRLGPSAGTLSAIALATGAYWLTHASVDWFWPYAAITFPVFALMGSASAPAVLALGGSSTKRVRRWIAAGAVALSLSILPAYLAERHVDVAYDIWRHDVAAAYGHLDRARTLNPLSVTSDLAEGSIARAAGDRKQAIDAFRRAAERQPENWVSHYYLALLQPGSDPESARRELARARELNPLGDRLDLLERRLLRSKP